jgi:hypothetical protein
MSMVIAVVHVEHFEAKIMLVFDCVLMHKYRYRLLHIPMMDASCVKCANIPKVPLFTADEAAKLQADASKPGQMKPMSPRLRQKEESLLSESDRHENPNPRNFCVPFLINFTVSHSILHWYLPFHP